MNMFFLASNFNRELEKKYGVVEHAGKKYVLTDYAEPKGRLLPDHQQGHFELSAPAVDEKGNECLLYWIFEVKML